MTAWFGEHNGYIAVNSAAGNRGGAGTVYTALGREPGDPVPKTELMTLAFPATDRRPPIDEIGFGQVAICKYVATQLAAMTRHEYSDQMVRNVVRGFPFIKYIGSMAWSYKGLLDNGVNAYLTDRDPRGGVRKYSNQNSESGRKIGM